MVKICFVGFPDTANRFGIVIRNIYFPDGEISDCFLFEAVDPSEVSSILDFVREKSEDGWFVYFGDDSDSIRYKLREVYIDMHVFRIPFGYICSDIADGKITSIYHVYGRHKEIMAWRPGFWDPSIIEIFEKMRREKEQRVATH